MLFQTKFGYQGRYRQLFVDYANKYGTLIDRDYTWSRVGGGAKDTNYSLMPEDKVKMSEKAKGAMKGLSDLGDVVCGKLRKFGQPETKENGKEEDPTETDSKNGEDLFK